MVLIRGSSFLRMHRIRKKIPQKRHTIIGSDMSKCWSIISRAKLQNLFGIRKLFVIFLIFLRKPNPILAYVRFFLYLCTRKCTHKGRIGVVSCFHATYIVSRCTLYIHYVYIFRDFRKWLLKYPKYRLLPQRIARFTRFCTSTFSVSKIP